jgi:hypothetical protein
MKKKKYKKREHVFKGKTVNGMWVYGSLVEGEWVYGGEKGVTFDEHASFIKNTYDEIEERVCPETVCEFTGKRDRLLHDIYEGDVLTNEENGSVWVVVYAEKYGLTAARYSNQEEKIALIPELLDNMRVVGNIHD